MAAFQSKKKWQIKKRSNKRKIKKWIKRNIKIVNRQGVLIYWVDCLEVLEWFWMKNKETLNKRTKEWKVLMFGEITLLCSIFIGRQININK